MAHWISAVITSFRYDGPEANVVLVGPFHLVLPGHATPPRFAAASVPPFTALTSKTRRFVRDLSFRGKCAYVETRFHGEGTQHAAVWHDGAIIDGPYVSYHGTANDGADEAAATVAGAVNAALVALGVYRHEGKDEFDSLRLPVSDGQMASFGISFEKLFKRMVATGGQSARLECDIEGFGWLLPVQCGSLPPED